MYQGMYNAPHCKVKPELFPCPRQFGIAFYACNPLAGGLFTGKYHSLHDEAEPGSRYHPNRLLGKVDSPLCRPSATP